MLPRIPRQVVGLDIGASAVRLLQLKRRWRRVSVHTYGCAPLPDDATLEGEGLDESAIEACLAPLVTTLPLSTRRVAIALGGRDVFVTRLQLPRLTARELPTAIRWEARAHLPFDVDDVALDYHTVTREESDPSRMDVVLAAAQLTTIERWRSLVARVGLQLAIVDVASLALQRACERLRVIAPNEIVLLVHIGTRATTLCLVGEGDRLIVRDLAIGGEAWTTALAREAGCTRQEAETRKQAFRLEGSEALAMATESFVVELGRTLAFVREHSGAPAPQRVVLSGGGGQLRGLDSVLATRLHCRIDVFDSFLELGPPWAVAIGLALRGVSP